MDLKKGPMNGIFLLPSRCPTDMVESRIRDFRANIVCYVHIPYAICCKCGWMKKRALFQFTTGTFVMVEIIINR